MWGSFLSNQSRINLGWGVGYSLVRLSPSLVVFVLLVYPSGLLIERGESVSP